MWVIYLLCSQGSSPQRGKDTISPVIGRNVKPTKHLRRSDGLMKQNSEIVLLLKITECHKRELDTKLLVSAQVNCDGERFYHRLRRSLTRGAFHST